MENKQHIDGTGQDGQDGERGVPAPGGVAAAGLPGLPPRLEPYDNNRNFYPTGRVFIKPCNCRCRTCPGCAKRYGWRVRQRLLGREEAFTRPALFTLTVARDNFASPLDAYLAITGGGFIRRLMRLLKVKAWAWTLEMQMKTGEGWPHWHLVIDLPSGGLDLPRAWHLWRDKWGLGGLDLQRKKNDDARHALMYVTKYLTKYPEKGFPDWVLFLDRRIRWVGASKAVGPVVADRELTTKDMPDDENAAESLPREHRSLAVRMSTCGESLNFFRELQDGEETKLYFFGRMPREIVEAARTGRDKVTIIEQDGKRYLISPHETFADLAGDLINAANQYPSACAFRHSHKLRHERTRLAGKITRGEAI